MKMLCLIARLKSSSKSFGMAISISKTNKKVENEELKQLFEVKFLSDSIRACK